MKQIASDLKDHVSDILSENRKDIENANANLMNSGLLDRLTLTEERINAMADGLLQIVNLKDPNGELLEEIQRPNGLIIKKKRVPIGVIGMIYESRPNVTADAFGLCFKSGNAVILKGGSDAIYSNIAITSCIRKSLDSCHINPNVIQLISDTNRETTNLFMKMDQYVDVLIPRGGASLIRNVMLNSTIPVIETGTGNCHIYIDEYADVAKAIPIIINAKTQRIGVCNACESLVVHERIAGTILPEIKKALLDKSVEIRGDQAVCNLITDCKLATEEDFGMEYLDLIISIKTVSTIEEAISHINKYNTKHSDVIITENKQNAEQFLEEIDAACVYVNASSRFSDGFEFGFGAEIGISTQKIHARGPMGLKELTSYKYMIEGSGQIRS